MPLRLRGVAGPCEDPLYDPWKRHDDACPAYANRVMIRLLRAVAQGLATGALDGPVAVVMDRGDGGEKTPYVATQEEWVPEVQDILSSPFDVVGYED